MNLRSIIPTPSVVIATGYGLGGRGSIPGRGKRVFSTPQGPDRLWAQPSIPCRVPWAPSSRVEQPGRQADHSFPPSCEVKNGGTLTPLLHTPSWHGA
jgi:hypothetical protein